MQNRSEPCFLDKYPCQISLHQITKIEEIYNRKLFDYQYKMPNERESSATGLITRNELEEILRQEINFEYLDKEFVYMG